MTGTAHYQAVKTHLEGDTKLAGKINLSAKLTTENAPVRDNYVILYPQQVAELDDKRFGKPQDADSDAEYVFPVKCVAVDAAGCAALVDAVFARLVGAQLTVVGRRLTKLRLTYTDSVVPDTSIKPALYYADLEFALISRRG